MRTRPRILLALEGLSMDGGVAAVSRCLARVLDEESEANRLERSDRILLHDSSSSPPPLPGRGVQICEGGRKLRFIWDLHRLGLRWRHDWVVFDHIGVARSGGWPLPGSPARYAVVVHGGELEAVAPGNAFERALRRAVLVITNSHFTAGRVANLLPDLANRIRPVPLCLEPEREQRWKAEAGHASPAEREPAALIVGRMWSTERGKGHDELIRAWPGVLKRVPAAELWIAGGGDDRPRLEALARETGAGTAIQFLGRISDPELADRYRRARVLSMPSRQEGFGLVYAEAMWHGLPCLGSTADAASEVIEDGVTGRLVPYGDVEAVGEGVAALLADPELAARLGAAGRARVEERYSYARFRSDMLEALGLG